MTPLRIFISSVQGEFASERAALRDYVRDDVLMRRFSTCSCSRNQVYKGAAFSVGVLTLTVTEDGS